jgi:hypothetical protein
MNLVDFCAIAPAYVELAFSGSGGGFAVLRKLTINLSFACVYGLYFDICRLRVIFGCSLTVCLWLQVSCVLRGSSE